ncbi:hypothetical protein VT91_25810 [Clostridium sporogenes]|uniref:DUF1648 domain-containing protein n=1 Tax=Clostridium botulinum TaxID=1491 RepID=UPI0007177911|nr:DUF1648 domain-containing protein [Clostridium botulinum]KRU27488.1 hypothetical protein VT28_26230 [Clostridium sporogenes]KRU27752.1 hypothetical protein VT91_25810 [Clostridium sporogenes]KRU32116.1 hypothetical protein WG71_01260 [Clostridium sporogenes]KRU44980.1 hypothetical protein VT95_12280 [Clostridium sporogenes]MBZ1330212.1 DUF1648 domain-containing protein [Clostridium botulinum]
MKIKNNKYDIIINFLSLLCLVGTVIFLIISWKTIPAEIPGHYNAAGEVDKIIDKNSLIVLLVVGWIMFIGLSIVEKFPQIWNTGIQVTEQNKEKVYRILKTMIGTIKLLVTLVSSYLTLHSVTGENLSPLFSPVFLILMFGPIVFSIFQLVKNK